MTETTILYCDLDGVLHALGTPAMDEFGTAHPESPGVFRWQPLLERALRPYPDMQIVVSSSWRFFHSDAELCSFLGPLGSPFAGTTTNEHEDWSRSEEILRHAEEHKIQHFLALDDHESVRARESNEGDQRFMWCSPDTGISPQRFLVRLHERLLKLHASIGQVR